MTIDELIERLNEYRETLGGEAEVRLMTQQAWPFENGICGVTSASEINDEAEDGDDSGERAIYIVEGQQLGYGSKVAWDVAY